MTDRRPTKYDSARAFVDELNGRTVCAHCGAQPVEWHNPEHVELRRETYRIGQMITFWRSVQEIEAELRRCTPLCRRCHMVEDGRIMNLNRGRPVQEPKPCTVCLRPSKPLRRGLCSKCSSRARYYRKTEGGENAGAVRARNRSRRP